MKILHITTHLGGGVGRFCSNIYGNDIIYEHEFLLIEDPIDTGYLGNIRYKLLKNIKSNVESYIAEFDIIQIEFWNHPALIKFLLNHDLSNSRILIYSHISGLYSPNLISDIIFDFCDLFVLSTPCSTAKYHQHIESQKCRVVHGVAGTDRFKDLVKEKNDQFNIAYIGTASFSKLHPSYLDLCQRIIELIPDVHFLFASNDSNIHLQEFVKINSLDKYFSFFTKMKDIEQILSQADLFGYPLRWDHFGTGEQALIEAMNAGIAPIVLSNPAESSLICDGVTGFVAADIDDYVNIVKFIYDNPNYTQKVGIQAKIFADENFAATKTLEKIQELYAEIISIPKRTHTFCKAISSLDPTLIGFEFFNLFTGQDSTISQLLNCEDKMKLSYLTSKFKRSLLMNENKGGIGRYLDVFPDDLLLRRIYELIV